MEEVRSETTGKVWKIEAAEGTEIGEEEAILILESMKMEIPVLAPRNGRIGKILVNEGDAVAEGQVVAVLE